MHMLARRKTRTKWLAHSTEGWLTMNRTLPTAKLIVSDWPAAKDPKAAFGQEQTFNFVEIEPYRE